MRRLALIGLPLLVVAVIVLAPIATGIPFAGSASTVNAQATSCSTNASGVLSAAQVAAYASAAGFKGADLVTAVAITMPESGANTTAVQNGGPIGGALIGIGLWQITPGTSADLDPLTNAKAAYAKYVAAGNSFTPWTTFTGGEYKAWISWAEAGIAAMSGSGITCTTGGLAAGPGGPVGSVTPESVPAGLASLVSFDGFPAGQCTIFAAWEFVREGHTVNWSGNADQWTANAKAAGHPESMTPGVGDIVVYGSGGGYSSFGHVAIVTEVQGSDFQVEEMNFLGVGQVDFRWSSMADVTSFITG